MAFPTSPTNGQTATVNGVVYTYNSTLTAWTVGTEPGGNVSGNDLNITSSASIGTTLSAAGNITGNYILGNGALLTGVITSVANINLGTSNVTVVSSNGNITMGVGGTSNVVVVATTGAYATNGYFSGNVGVGTTAPLGKLQISAATTALTGGYSPLNIFSTDAIGADKGGRISFGGVSGAVGFDPYGFCAIAGLKDNATASNFAGYLTFSTATSGGTVTERMRIDSSGNTTVTGSILPSTGNTYDLGSTAARWRNIYTNDLQLNNGIGDYTIVEGEDDLFLYNNKKGKVYKFALVEVDPATAPPKAETD